MRQTLVFMAAVAALTACESSTESKPTYSASMTGAKERPNPVTSNGTGTFTATLDGNTLTYELSFTGLSTNSTGAHIHGPATTEQFTNVLVDFNATAAGRSIILGAASGTGSGTINIAPTAGITATVSGDSLRKLLDLGLLYVNVHSTQFGAGEIRGQITRQ